MKAFKFIIPIIASGVLLASCDDNGQPDNEPGMVGAVMGISSARIVSPTDVVIKSHTDGLEASESQPVTVLNDPETGSLLSVSTTVSPMESDNAPTKVTEMTTTDLSSFTVEGYLGDEIETCRWAEPNDLANRHFINGATVEKGTDSYWYFQGEAPKWRSCVNHHFWAYNGTPTGFTVSGDNFDQSDFSYTNTGAEDLVIAYQEQMWVDEVEGKVGTEDAYPVKGLKFKHALAEVIIDYSSIVMKMLAVNGGEYVDIPSSSKPELNPRLSINKVQLLTPSKGTCNVSVGENGVEFNWTCPLLSNGTVDGYTPCECTGTAPTGIFVIPQNSVANVVVLNVYDKWRDLNTPVFIELPSMSDGDKWQPGYRYYYKIKGTLVAPFYDDSGELNPNFKGKEWQKFVIMKNLLSKYVRKIRVSWEGLPSVNSNSTPCAMLYLKNGEEPNETNYPMNGLSSITWHTKDNVGFVAATSHQKVEAVKKGTATGLDDASTAKCSAEFIVPDDVDPPLTFYLLYKGDNNGNAQWILKHLKVEVIEFKYPIQVI